MNCVSCDIDVSPNFVACIEDNRCPACGDKLMSNSDYSKLFSLKRQLLDLNLGLDKQKLTMVSAAITSKFELWPKGAAGTSEITEGDEEIVDEDIPLTPPPAKKVSAKPIKTVGTRSHPINDPSLIGDIDLGNEAPMSPDEEAALIKEFGLDQGEFGVAQARKDEGIKGIIDPELAKSIVEYDFEDTVESQDRLNRAQKMMSQVPAKKIKRI